MSGDAGALDAFHEPVMVDEVLERLDPAGDGFYLDGTVGGGGHAQALLERCPDCRLLAVDRDGEALARAEERLAPWRQRVRFLRVRFDRAVDDLEVRDRGLDGALLDLGVSSHQLDTERRGFTYRPEAPLDMRMEGTAGKEDQGVTAADLLNQGSEDELLRIFREFGEERRAKSLVRAIVERREERPFETSRDLVEAMEVAYGRPAGHQDRARIFQALRIAVNDELAALDAALPALRDALKDGAVLVVIAYHSLEDRIVKHTFREWSRSCVCPPRIPVCRCRGRALGETLTTRPMRPTKDEVARNPRARSARLRAWRKAA